ncbi:MAG: cytochrome c peroxidase, partial [Gammaproteobacteria bacterium]
NAAVFGRHLFFDERFSHNSKVSCATCHIPQLFFTDGLIKAAGAQAGIRNTPTLVGAAYSPWQFWDGRSDSQWSQALAPLENKREHAASRTQFAHIVFEDNNYRTRYESLFGPIPDFSDYQRFPAAAAPVDDKILNEAWQSMTAEDRETVTAVFVNIAKSIAAYERLLRPSVSRFDHYVKGVISNDAEKLTLLNKDEIAGLKLFIGKAQCINCHNGPLFTNNEFHNTGILSAKQQLPSLGRVSGVRIALTDPFNCLGKYSDAKKEQCADLRFAKLGDELIGAHKVPTLRNVTETAPYMHAGQLDSLDKVIEHYNQAPLAMIGHNETKPLKLSKGEKKQLKLFLHSLSGPLSTNAKWLKKPTYISNL